MGGQHAHRLLLVALSAVLAGVLAIPAKLAPPPGSVRVATSVGPAPLVRHPAVASPVVVTPPPPPPRQEHAIQPPPVGLAPTDALQDIVGAAARRDRPPALRGPTTDAAKTVFGLVIGINDYPGTSSDLQGAVPDAEDMSDALAMYGVPDANVRTLLDSDAGTPQINDALQWIDSVTKPDSTVVIFYAGHVRKLSDQTEAIIAADGGVLPDWYLAAQLQSLPAHDVWIVMAACYGGGFTELLAPGRMLTAAADANSLAYENDSFDRSYLDEYLVHEALLERLAEGPTAQQAFNYAQAGLERDYPDRTLTQFDESTEAISLDGVHRLAPPTTSDGSGDPGSGETSLPGVPSPGDPPPSPSPPSNPPSPPPPCKNLLGLFCPPGSR
jgi:hypothetical protein